MVKNVEYMAWWESRPCSARVKESEWASEPQMPQYSDIYILRTHSNISRRSCMFPIFLCATHQRVSRCRGHDTSSPLPHVPVSRNVSETKGPLSTCCLKLVHQCTPGSKLKLENDCSYGLSFLQSFCIISNFKRSIGFVQTLAENE